MGMLYPSLFFDIFGSLRSFCFTFNFWCVMKNNKTNYRLVARMKGDSLTIVREEMSRLAALYDRRVDALYRNERNEDRRAHLASVEMERKGDFLWACGAKVSAIRAYIEAAELALDGKYYDAGAHHRPADALYQRSRELVRKIRQCAATDRRLAELVQGDRALARLL